MIDLAHLPFLAHAIIESLAAYSFIFKPQTQISPLQPAARLVLECYGGLLFFSTFIALIFLSVPGDSGICRLAACAFAFWHLWPSRRAVIRMQQPPVGLRDATASTLGGPSVHLWVHAVLFMGFGLAAMFG